MMRRAVLVVGGVAMLLLAAWALTRGLERVMQRPDDSASEQPDGAPPAEAPVRHITATLFYGSDDGMHLVPVQREVPYGEGAAEQGRQILLAQLTIAPEPPLVQVIPRGSTLRSFYVSGRGDAFVDLGREIVKAHPGGSTAELLTVYAIVHAVLANLPALTSVQILVDGHEVDTLAGHVDLRRPLQRNDAMVLEPR